MGEACKLWKTVRWFRLCTDDGKNASKTACSAEASSWDQSGLTFWLPGLRQQGRAVLGGMREGGRWGTGLLPGCLCPERLWAVEGMNGDRGESRSSMQAGRWRYGRLNQESRFLEKAGLLKPEKNIVKKSYWIFTQTRQPGSPLEQLTEEMNNSALMQQIARCLHISKLGSVWLYMKDILLFFTSIIIINLSFWQWSGIN